MRARRSDHVSGRILCGLLCTFPAWAYRPYDATDADVADDDEVELEIGWRNSQFADVEEHAVRATANFGIAQGREVVLEGEWQHFETTFGETESSVSDLGLFLKQVHRRGSLQGGQGLSIASECGVLIPTSSEESGPGGECLLIASHSTAALSMHVNAAIAFETDHHWEQSFGLIVEGPASWRLRPGFELLHEDAEGDGAEMSVLAGVVWSASKRVALDMAFRRGLEPSGEPDEWRMGMTWLH
jgi:hypothetical protein